MLLDDLARDPAKAVELTPSARATLLAQALAVVGALASPAVAAPSQGVDVEWLTVEQVAERLKLAKSYVYQLARRNDLPSVKRGKYVRISAARLSEWIAAIEGSRPSPLLRPKPRGSIN